MKTWVIKEMSKSRKKKWVILGWYTIDSSRVPYLLFIVIKVGIVDVMQRSSINRLPISWSIVHLWTRVIHCDDASKCSRFIGAMNKVATSLMCYCYFLKFDFGLQDWSKKPPSWPLLCWLVDNQLQKSSC